MKTEKLITLEDYYRYLGISDDLKEKLFDDIKIADALVEVNGTQHLDFALFDSCYLYVLNSAKSDAQNKGLHDIVKNYAESSNMYFGIRYRFISSLCSEYIKKNTKDENELRRLFEISTPGFLGYAKHFIDAYDLLFKTKKVSESSGDTDDHNSEDSNET